MEEKQELAGLDRILSEITAQGKANADAEIASARQKADRIKADGDKEAHEAYSEYIAAFEKKAAADYASACAAADARLKRETLRCRAECIDDAVEEALKQLSQLSTKDYFELIIKLAAKNMRSGEGVISFNSIDLKRLPADMEKRLNEQAAKKASSIRISDEPADIENGFILSYGNIFENCSFSAIVEAQRDQIRDLAASILFE